jgi:hypothetical protein
MIMPRRYPYVKGIIGNQNEPGFGSEWKAELHPFPGFGMDSLARDNSEADVAIAAFPFPAAVTGVPIR